MPVIESVKEGLKAAAIGISIVVLAAFAYVVAVKLPVTLDGINRAVSNANNLMEKAMPVVDDCKKFTRDLTNTEDESSLRGKIDGAVNNVNKVTGQIKGEIEAKGGISAVIEILRGVLKRNSRDNSPPR